MTPDEMRAYIETAPDPLDGPPIYSREIAAVKDATGMSEAYEVAAAAAAKAMLIVCLEDPSLLNVPSKEDDPTGIERAFADAHWEKAKERWPGLDDWLGGISGFQFGWANNAVRYALGVEPVGNPAIMSIG